jgi:predicted RND superfamily exporter protein
VPAAAGVLFALGVPAALRQTLNLCHITAAAVVFGLCTDYGIYMTHAIAHRMEARGKTTIVLTTATSVIGSGVLLFTQHPVLFALGLTITAGMIAGHVTAIWGVPSLVELCGFGNKKPAGSGAVFQAKDSAPSATAARQNA